MTIRTLFLYLIGNRQAILAIAANRSALLIGFLFVLSAGLAREYDNHDLVHEPWHVLLPLVASAPASGLGAPRGRTLALTDQNRFNAEPAPCLACR